MYVCVAVFSFEGGRGGVEVVAFTSRAFRESDAEFGFEGFPGFLLRDSI